MANRSLAIPRTLLDQYLTKAAEAMAEKGIELGERIKTAREDRGWKQKDLAARVHVEPMTVSRWERGVNTPDIETLRLIAKVTQKPLGYFVEEKKAIASTDQRLTQLEQNQTTAIDLLQELVDGVNDLKEAVRVLDVDVRSMLEAGRRPGAQRQRKA